MREEPDHSVFERLLNNEWAAYGFLIWSGTITGFGVAEWAMESEPGLFVFGLLSSALAFGWQYYQYRQFVNNFPSS